LYFRIYVYFVIYIRIDQNLRRIAVAFDLNQRQSSELFTGVSDYVRTHGLNWQLVPLGFGFESKLMELAQSGKLHGAIGTFVSDSWLATLIDLNIAVINVFNFSKIERSTSVAADDQAIGRAAAQHLIQQGARSFAFFGGDAIYSTRLRSHGFSHQLHSESILQLGSPRQLQDLITADTRFAKPMGIFCASDKLARTFIQHAALIGLKQKVDYLILGVDDDPAESIFAGIEISSFHLPIPDIGYEAARVLHQTLSGHICDTRKIILDSHKLIARASSLASESALSAQRASNYIEEQLSDASLSVDRIAAWVGVSRRSLELQFQEHLHTSPYKLLSKFRGDKAERLLFETKHSVMEVGRLCGYPDPHHFSIWFKKQPGLAPKQFREKLSNKTKDS
jgi:LacI family transcriptional regulator